MNAAESPLRPLPADQRSCAVLVIGAGIVGVATALRLQREGRDVWLIDRERVAAQASRGNAGALAFSDIMPLASAGILRQAPRWLLDPLGPLTIRPSTCRASLHGCCVSGMPVGATACAPAPPRRRR